MFKLNFGSLQTGTAADIALAYLAGTTIKLINQLKRINAIPIFCGMMHIIPKRINAGLVCKSATG
jgi:hypothetical protein